MFKHQALTASCFAVVLLGLLAALAVAQSSQFSYQGQLNDGGSPAAGSYDLQFKLFDALSGGAQIGSTNSLTNVVVTGGLFKVTLDFGAEAFPGAPRWLEISVRLAGVGTFTTLSPRQALSPTPYAIQSLNAATATNATNATNATTAVNFSGPLAGAVTGTQSATVLANNAVTTEKLANASVTDAKIAAVAGSKITGTIPVAALPANSANYIQNTTTLQASSNFNLSGNGTAGGTLSGNIVNATTQFNLGGNRVLSVPGSNTFAGVSAGSANTSGTQNSFFGNQAGESNTEGHNNSFFGRQAGQNNNTGGSNAFFGTFAGEDNVTGHRNSFFGESAGAQNTNGENNSFFGRLAGSQNSSGSDNTYIGYRAGNGSISINAANKSTALGADASIEVNNLSYATVIGAGASVSTSNTVVLGRSADTVQVPGSLIVNSALTASGASSLATVPIAILESSGTNIPLAFKIGATEQARIRYNSTDGLILAALNGNDLRLRAGDDATTDLFIDGSTNFVGIGVTIPADRLHVSGEVRVANCVRNQVATQIAGTCPSDLRFKRIGPPGFAPLC